MRLIPLNLLPGLCFQCFRKNTLREFEPPWLHHYFNSLRKFGFPQTPFCVAAGAGSKRKSGRTQLPTKKYKRSGFFRLPPVRGDAPGEVPDGHGNR